MVDRIIVYLVKRVPQSFMVRVDTDRFERGIPRMLILLIMELIRERLIIHKLRNQVFKVCHFC